MSKVGITKAQRDNLKACVARYKAEQAHFDMLLDIVFKILTSSRSLKPIIHSVRGRLKDPTHLYGKLVRKQKEANRQNRNFLITPKNILQSVTDLVGLRILHLHTEQAAMINDVLPLVLGEHNYTIVEGPVANTWDDEYRNFFKKIGMEVASRESLYSSIHYLVRESAKTGYRFEIQVRTLAEEVWGELSHTINYPEETRSLACREQIKALARVTSSCTRLVDAVMRTHADFLKKK